MSAIVIFRFVLYYMVSFLSASPICLLAAENMPRAGIGRSEITNHHIFYRQDKRAPLTSIEIVFLGAGRNQERPSQMGLAETTAWLIKEYAKTHGYLDQLSALGTRLNVITSTRYQRIAIPTLSENCGKSVEIVRDIIHNLDFSESDLKKVKKLKLADYENDIRRRTHTFMRNFALAQTRGIKKLNSLKTLKDLSLEDVRQYYARLLKTDVVFFKVISDLDSTQVAELLLPITETRQRGGFEHSLKFPTADYSINPSAFVYTNYSRLKSVFCHWLIPFGSIGGEDHIPTLISYTLSHYPGLLHHYLREEWGLAYSLYCRTRLSGDIRYLDIYADPQLQNSEELIVKMSDFIRGLSDNPRFWEALKERREILKVSDVHNQTPQRSLDREINRAIYNTPIHKGSYDSITDDEVRAFLEKFFVPENMIMIFVGPKDHIIDILNKHLPEVDIRVHDVKELIE
ncbi:MAG: insulinase family protein [Candidatus Latescibacteria bacterium]|nr:insulinase family protein [Candidatus Latescibacterota bacterium]